MVSSAESERWKHVEVHSCRSNCYSATSDVRYVARYIVYEYMFFAMCMSYLLHGGNSRHVETPQDTEEVHLGKDPLGGVWAGPLILNTCAIAQLPHVSD